MFAKCLPLLLCLCSKMASGKSKFKNGNQMDLNLQQCLKACGFTMEIKDTHKCCTFCLVWKHTQVALTRTSLCDWCHRLSSGSLVRPSLSCGGLGFNSLTGIPAKPWLAGWVLCFPESVRESHSGKDVVSLTGSVFWEEKEMDELAPAASCLCRGYCVGLQSSGTAVWLSFATEVAEVGESFTTWDDCGKALLDFIFLHEYFLLHLCHVGNFCNMIFLLGTCT